MRRSLKDWLSVQCLRDTSESDVDMGITWDYLMRLNVPVQEQDNWCWAAMTVGIARKFLKWDPRQCEIAEGVLGNNCCQNPEPCDVTSPLPPGLKVIGCYSSQVSAPLPLKEIKDELKHGRPVGVRYAWNSRRAHFCLINGVSTSGELSFLDSLFNPSVRLYSDSLDHYQNVSAQWTHSYLLQMPAKAPSQPGAITQTATATMEPSFAIEGIGDTIEGMKLDLFIGDADSLASGGGIDPKPAGSEILPDQGDDGTAKITTKNGAVSYEHVRHLKQLRDLVINFKSEGLQVALLQIPSVLITALWLRGHGREWICPVEPSTRRIKVGLRYERRDFESAFRPYAEQLLADGQREMKLTYPGNEFRL